MKYNKKLEKMYVPSMQKQNNNFNILILMYFKVDLFRILRVNLRE